MEVGMSDKWSRNGVRVTLIGRPGHTKTAAWEAASMAHRHKATKRSKPKTILRLPDLEQSKNAVLNSLAAPSSQESYGHAIEEFISWYCSEPRWSFSKPVVTRYRIYLEFRQLAPGTINGRLAAVRRLAYAAADSGLLRPGAPIVPAGAVVNNASYAPGPTPLAPGTIVAIFGTNLTNGTSCLPPLCNPVFDKSSGKLGTTMAGAQVLVNGTAAPIFYAAPTQLGIQIPIELTGTSC